MRVGLIKNNVCINIIIADSITTAEKLFPVGEYDQFIPIPDGETSFGKDDHYENGLWTSTKPNIKDWTCPNCSNTSPISLRVCDICGYDSSGLF